MNVPSNSLVSIIMPVFNAEPFIEQTIRSIIDQTHENWELIAVDDNSTDQSAEIVTRFASKDSRIKIISTKGNGIIDALREGFLVAEGEYITRMDADDVMDHRKLEFLSEQLRDAGEGHVVIAKVEYFSESQLGKGYKNYAMWLNRLTVDSTNFDEIYKECPIPSPCWMLHTSDLNKIDAFEPDRYPEDYDLAFRMLEGGLRVVGINTVLHKWRDHESRTSRTDDIYADNSFIELKVFWFDRLDRKPEYQLCLWGAGSRGKKIADQLIRNQISFRWFSNNPKKIGKDIYGIVIEPISSIPLNSPVQLIDSVADKSASKAKLEMRSRFSPNYFAFC